MALPITDPKLKSWVEVPADSDFPIHNLPFGIFTHQSQEPRVCTAIGQYVADLFILSEHGFFDDLGLETGIFQQATLNAFIRQGRSKTNAVRQRLADILDDDLEEWDASELSEFFLIEQTKVIMHLPVAIGDYTDFYSSKEHATNVGNLFRGADRALMPNWLHMPIGYHGRSSTISVSGTPVIRPVGQYVVEEGANPVMAPTQRLDFELETAFIIGKDSNYGTPVATDAADEYIFGVVLFNDWSARDIQQWEYQPLGPFLGKSFASTISPWVVTMEALESFRVAGPVQEPTVLPHLQFSGNRSYDIHLEAILETKDGQRLSLSQTNHKHLYWTMVQQLAHQTSNGCNVRVGDLYASGTISGPDPGSLGSMLEITQNGQQPLVLPDGTQRTFLEDGDTIILKGVCEGKGLRIGFGEVRATIHPAP